MSRDTTLDAFSSSELPFEVMVKHLKFEREPEPEPYLSGLIAAVVHHCPENWRLGNFQLSF